MSLAQAVYQPQGKSFWLDEGSLAVPYRLCPDAQLLQCVVDVIRGQTQLQLQADRRFLDAPGITQGVPATPSHLQPLPSLKGWLAFLLSYLHT